jgi:hypothetical protein
VLFRLTELANNKDAFTNVVEKPMLGLIDILEMFHNSLDLPLDAFFQLTDRLMVSIFYHLKIYSPATIPLLQAILSFRMRSKLLSH